MNQQRIINYKFAFVGFWSQENPQILLKQLQEIAGNHLLRYGKVNLFYWGVVGSNCLGNSAIAALSVGGFSNTADAWVKVEQNRLILGRDPFGRATLYWLQQGDIIWFASQFQALLSLIENPMINRDALYGYCCFSYVPTPDTPMKDIHAVEAGQEIIFSGNAFKKTEREIYTFSSADATITDEDEAISQLETQLKTALQKQISDLNDEPVGICLSGGLDSSLIAALLVKAGLKVRAYTLDFPDVILSETPYAERVAEYLDIPLIKIPVTAKEVKKVLPEMIKALDLPFGDSVTVPLYLLYQRAKTEVSVLFNGENGDQLFAGWTNKPILTATVYQSHHPDSDFTTDYLRTFHRLYGYEKQVFSSHLLPDINPEKPRHWLQNALAEEYTTGIFDRFRRASLMLKGAQNIQPRASNLALAQGLTLRSPFCDFPLTEWTFHLSGELILRQSCEKYILKRVAENWLPPEIVWREKRGMGVPLTQWFFQDLWSFVRQYLSPNRFRQEGFFAPELALKIVRGELGAMSWGRRVGEILWLLLVWELWRDRVFGTTVTRNSWFNPFWLPPQWLRRNQRED